MTNVWEKLAPMKQAGAAPARVKRQAGSHLTPRGPWVRWRSLHAYEPESADLLASKDYTYQLISSPWR